MNMGMATLRRSKLSPQRDLFEWPYVLCSAESSQDCVVEGHVRLDISQMQHYHCAWHG